MLLKELFESAETTKKSVRILGKMNGNVVRKDKHMVDSVVKSTAKKKMLESNDIQKYYAVAYNPEDNMKGDIRFTVRAHSNKSAFDYANKEAIKLNKSHVFVERDSGVKIYDGSVKGN